jgi:hypothetical protein
MFNEILLQLHFYKFSYLIIALSFLRFKIARLENTMKFYTTLFLCCLPISTWAASPLFTDDATLTVAHTCQIENSFLHSTKFDQTTILPACNPTGNFEFTTGLTRTRYHNGSPQEYSYILQGKTLIRPLDDDNDFGYGFVFGIIRPDHNNGENYAYVPFTITSPSQDWSTSFNLGWRRYQEYKTNVLTWGVSTAYTINPHVDVFAEVFGENKTKPTLHGGFIVELIPDEISLNLTVGDDLSEKNGGAFYGIGLSFYMPKPK